MNEVLDKILGVLQHLKDVLFTNDTLVKIIIISIGVAFGIAIYKFLEELCKNLVKLFKNIFIFLFAMLKLPARIFKIKRKKRAKMICSDCGFPIEKCKCKDKQGKSVNQIAKEQQKDKKIINRARKHRS